MPKIVKKQAKGTTIIEVVIAVFIITIGILGGLGAASNSSAKVGISQEEIVAANLAREGIEVVRNIRDSNWLKGNPWDQGISGAASERGGLINFNSTQNQWTITHLADPLSALNNETSRLYLNNGFYTTSSGGAKTRLKRIVEIINVAPGEKKIVSTVRVEFKNLTKNVVVEDHLYDWK